MESEIPHPLAFAALVIAPLMINPLSEIFIYVRQYIKDKWYY